MRMGMIGAVAVANRLQVVLDVHVPVLDAKLHDRLLEALPAPLGP